MAVSQGIVEFSGWKRGYGKTIILITGPSKPSMLTAQARA